jgi:hypothetical protein
VGQQSTQSPLIRPLFVNNAQAARSREKANRPSVKQNRSFSSILGLSQCFVGRHRRIALLSLELIYTDTNSTANLDVQVDGTNSEKYRSGVVQLAL